MENRGPKRAGGAKRSPEAPYFLHRRWPPPLSDSFHFMQECEENKWQPGAVESFDKRMMALFNMESPGLRILPTHRALRDLVDFNLEEFLSVLASEFMVHPQNSVEELRGVLDRSSRTLGMISGRPPRAYSLETQRRIPVGPARAFRDCSGSRRQPASPWNSGTPARYRKGGAGSPESCGLLSRCGWASRGRRGRRLLTWFPTPSHHSGAGEALL